MHCQYCKSLDPPTGEDPVLRSLIITPTFMKSLDNLSIKTIWHNAYIDLCDAYHIVFIGYSFPDADFEMRCLLKKAVSSRTRITVVLNDANDPQRHIDSFSSLGLSLDEAKKLVGRMWLPESRYKSFFGEDRILFKYDGFEKYLNEMGEI